MQVRLGIAVVTYNSDATLSDCLTSIAAHHPDALVAISENSGQIDSLRQVAADHPGLDVTVLDPGGNVGFARGVNLAAAKLEAAGCTHLLILNPDVELLADPLLLVPFLERVDVVGGVLVGDGQAEFFDSAGMIRPSNAKRRVTWASTLVQALVGTRFNGAGAIKAGELQPVPQLDGAYLLQTTAYYQANPLDDRFELYFEDVDYCDRARAKRGVAMVGTVVGRHVAGVSYRSSGGRAYLANRVSHARYLRGRYPRLPRAALRLPFALELLTRGLTRQAEGPAIRAEAFRLVSAELRNPGSVAVLDSPARQGRGVDTP